MIFFELSCRQTCAFRIMMLCLQYDKQLKKSEL
nr:MAG TPA: hypothetical protein [Caudoviricetes sp.]